MAKKIEELYVEIKATNDKLRRDLNSANKDIKKFAKTGKKSASGFSSFWKNAMSTAVGVGFVQILGSALGLQRACLAYLSLKGLRPHRYKKTLSMP